MLDVDLCGRGEYQEKHCVLLASGHGIGVGLQLHQLHHLYIAQASSEDFMTVTLNCMGSPLPKNRLFNAPSIGSP